MTSLATASTRATRGTGTVEAARARLRALGADEHVRALVQSAPPPSVETRARLAAILLGGWEQARP